MSGQRVVAALGWYVLQADEIGVKLSWGKYSGTVGPGLNFASPMIERVLKTKSSLQTIDLADQQIVLSGNIAVTISGNLNFRVAQPEKALLQLNNYGYTVQQFAMTTISDVLSTKTIEEVRTSKASISQEIEDIVAEKADAWGLADVDIRLTDARMDESLMRAMMRETESQKEAMAAQIRANADRAMAESLSDAAKTLAESPGAMTLRVLQSLSDLSDKSTVVVPLPIDLLTGIGAGSSNPQNGENTTAKRIVDNNSEGGTVIPACKLEYETNRTMAVCPVCQQKYNVTNIQGDVRYDKLPDVPGLQLQCKKCETVFTLPGSS